MSVIIEEAIRGWMAANRGLREQVVRQGVERFFATLGDREPTTPDQVGRAVAAARDTVFAALTAQPVLDALPFPPVEPGAREALRSHWYGLNPAWVLPGPPTTERSLSAQRLAIAAGGGSLLGMLIFGTLFNLSLDLRAIGMLIGAPAGAAGAMYAVGRLAESKALRVALTTLLGLAGTLDLARVATLGAVGLWGRLAGVGLLRRILLYPGVVALLAFTKGSSQYDRGAYRESIQDLIRQWVDGSAILLCSLATAPVQAPRGPVLDPDLARAIQDLHRADLPGLPAAAEALLLEARRLGLAGLTDPARFTAAERAQRRRLRWGPELAEHYRPFGLIEAGDTVIVEDEPVIQNDTVLEKGLVRKQRS
ncbi:hypothetical protein [uncultured Thiodictyon sp.]|uniref:hypothetical protein n=1 Tax=uncultured Thiodictyon sp. TaxID=1846217 RepID=UPI0025FBF64B|nr:hypothetical protein [uncultured Thiodictyon sp.]